MRQAVQEVGGAVQRVDDPAAGRILARLFAGFLADPAIVRPCGAQFFLDDALGLAVGAADEVARALDRDLKVLDLAEVLDEAAARLARGLIMMLRLALAMAVPFWDCQPIRRRTA